jgi:Deoxyribonuclease NucA/NucB
MPGYPVLEFDWKELPNIADNIWQAQMAGWERVLTYRGPLPEPASRGIRGQTMTYDINGQGYRIPKFATANARDEYPFACTAEGASMTGERKPWVGHVPPYENFVQGGMLSAFIKQHGITAAGPNCKFEVRVINHPRGKVLP